MMQEEYEPPIKKDRLDIDEPNPEEAGESNVSKEKEDLKTLCQSHTVKSFATLHRLDKYVSALLIALRDSLSESNINAVPEQLSKKWCDEFEAQTANLPSRQSINILTTLLYHLTQDCIEPLENNPLDVSSLKIIPTLTQLLCIHLRGVRMAEHTVPALLVGKFINLMTNLKALLGRLGSALLNKEHSHTLMVSFLSSCLAWGDLEVLIMYYRPPEDVSEMSRLFQTDTSAENLSGLHLYLSGDQWSLVAQRITNFGKPLCKHLLNQLVLQKLRAMILLNDAMCKDSSMVAAKHLISHMDDKWLELLENDGLILISKLESTQVMALANHIVKDVACKEKWSDEEFQTVGFQENRPLVLALLVNTLEKISKLFTASKRKRDSIVHQKNSTWSQLVQNVYCWVDPGLILDNDAQALDKVATKIISNMASCINECLEKLDETTKTSLLKVDMNLLERYLTILRALPVQHLPQAVQSVVFCCLISLAINLQAVDSREDCHQTNGALKILHNDLLLDLLDGGNAPNLTEHIHPGWLVQWLLRTDLQMSEQHRHKLLNLLFNMSLSDLRSLKLLKVGIPLLDNSFVNEQVGAAHVESALILLETMRKLRKVDIDAEHASTWRKMISRLSQNLISVVQNGNFVENHSSKLVVETYHVILQMNFEKSNSTELSEITQHLDMIIKMALPGLSSGEEYCIVFVTLLLKNRKKLSKVLSADFLRDIIPQTWKVLSTGDKVTEHHKTLLEVASEEQFSSITDDLLNDMTLSTSGSCADSSSMFEKHCGLWTSVIKAEIDQHQAKNRIRLRKMHKLYGVLLAALQLGHIKNTKPILQFNLALINSSQIKLQEEMIGFCLESISAIPLNELETIMLALQLLAALLQRHSKMVMDFIPAFLQRYSCLVVAVSTLGRQDSNLDTKEDLLMVEACAHSLEKLANSMVVHYKEFQRIAPYIVSDILNLFEVSTLRPAVKLHFLNAVYSFLKICDTHAIGYLTHALMPASKQIFQTVYQDYKRHYHFTGRV